MKTLVLTLVCALPLAAGAADSFLLRGATVHPVTGPEIAGGMVLVVDGKIADVGAKLAAPKGVKVIDVKGLHVYPGMIDSNTKMGLQEVSSVRETDDSAEIGEFNQQVRAIIAVNPGSEHIPVTRANGITSVVTAPDGGILAGQAALIHLDGWTWQEMAVVPALFQHVVFPSLSGPGGRGEGRRGGGSSLPFSELKRAYDKKLQALGEQFENARRYQRAKQAKARDFTPDVKMEALLPVLEGKQKLVVTAARERAIKDALAWAKKENLPIIISNASEAYKVAAELKASKTPVILPPTLSLPNDEDDPYDKPYAQPGELYKAGVKFAFASVRLQFARNLPYQAATAVGFGLPYAEALKAVTINPAEIWGVGDKLGSIEKGKLADLIVTTGDPLEARTEVKQVFIRGRAVDLSNKHTRLYEKYMARP